MNILIVSESFIVRENMEQLFKEVLEYSSISIKTKLSKTTQEELLQTDFVFIDTHNDVLNELKIIDYIKIRNKNLKVLVSDRNKNKNTFKKVLAYGIEGYITNTIEKEEFIFLLKKVIRGKKAYETDLIDKVVNGRVENKLDQLTKREQEVLREMSKGLNNKEIADNLFITESTVKKHVSNIFSKLDFRIRKDAILFTSTIS